MYRINYIQKKIVDNVYILDTCKRRHEQKLTNFYHQLDLTFLQREKPHVWFKAEINANAFVENVDTDWGNEKTAAPDDECHCHCQGDVEERLGRILTALQRIPFELLDDRRSCKSFPWDGTEGTWGVEQI